MITVDLFPSPNKDKKYTVIIYNDDTKIKTLHFGASGYSDYTTHKDDSRKQAYLTRHKSNEHWSDIKTAGFWARWILWNLPTFQASINDTEKRFNLKINVRSTPNRTH